MAMFGVAFESVDAKTGNIHASAFHVSGVSKVAELICETRKLTEQMSPCSYIKSLQVTHEWRDESTGELRFEDVTRIFS